MTKRSEIDGLVQKYAKRDAALEHKGNAKALAKEVERLQRELDAALGLEDRVDQYQPTAIKQRERGTAKEGMAVLLLSDLHPEEVIRPETVNGMNDFSPKVASQRIDRLITGTRWALETVRASEGRAGYKIRDFMLAILGDLISNTIHPDLAESVAMGPADAVDFTFELIQRVIDSLLADTSIERLVVPCCMGNHDRLTHKNRHQTKAQTSLATIIYAMLRRMYRNEPRVTFDIARGNMVYVNVYGKLVRCTHGDDIGYGGGIGGITIPVRKKISQWNKTIHAALTLMGHFHTTMETKESAHNGSLIGYSGFSQAIGADFEPASQSFFVIDAQRGKRMFTPVQVQDCEQWS